MARQDPSAEDPCPCRKASICKFLVAVYGKMTPSTRLWHLSPATLRKRFSALQVALGLDKTDGRVTLPYSLASLRPGGIYLQEAEFATYRNKMSSDSRYRIDRLCRSFPGILEKSVFFLKCSIPENAWPKLW